LALLQAFESAVEPATEDAPDVDDGRLRIPAQSFAGLLYLKARFTFDLGRPSEALGLAQAALGFVGAADSLRLSVRTLQHLIEQRLGDLDSARRGLEEVRQEASRLLGEADAITLTASSYLATVLLAEGQAAEARPLLEEVLAVRRQQLSEGHPETLTAMHNLAGCLNDLGEHGEAKEIYQRTVHIGRQVLGPNHPGTLISMQNLATTQVALGEIDEARALFEETLEAQRRLLGDGHPFSLTLMDELCHLLDDHPRTPGFRERLRSLRHELLTGVQRLPAEAPLRLRVEARWLPSASADD
jgi:tetratricopeptide (TPR) repeat protein